MLAMTQYECSNAVFSMKTAFIIIISTSFMVNYDVFYFEKKKPIKLPPSLLCYLLSREEYTEQNANKQK